MKDELFIRGNVPMTKEEIRVLTLSKLELKENDYVIDIGAGTGSLSIESALQCKKGKVFAVERNPEGIELIKKNKEHFKIDNIEIIEGFAPSALEPLNTVDKIIIGGSGGQLNEILKKSKELLKPNGKIVINAILLKTVYETLHWLDYHNYRNIDLMQVSISRGRKLGKNYSLSPLNPIFIIWAEK